MVKRRSMVVGLGALATGSGAVFSSAAFANSAPSTADFRVVVEDNLVVEAGRSFRNGEGVVGGTGDDDKFYTNDGLFSGERLAGLSPEDLPAAWANNGTNSDLDVQTAVENLSGTYEFSNFLQVRNDGTEDAEVGIKFEEYGEDVNDGPIEPANLIEAYEFFSDGGDGGKISTNSDANNAAADQTVANTTTVPVGETIQIGLTVDLTSDNIRAAIADAATPNTGDVFNGDAHDTVRLVDELLIGSDSTADDTAN